MNSVQEAVGVAAELFTWLGIGVGLLCFIVLWMLRGIRGRPTASEAVLIETPTGLQVRWLAEDGLLRSRPLHDDESDQPLDVDELQVYYWRRSPDVVELHPVDHGERVLRLLGLIFLGVAALAIIVSVVAMTTG